MAKTVLVLFGATGDLAREKLFPGLAMLCEKEKLPEDFTIFALGRREYDTPQFIEQISAKQAYSESFTACIHYFKVDLTVAAEYDRLAQEITSYENRLFYLAVAPTMYRTVLQGISLSQAYREHDGGWSRVVIEKPFGVDHATAQDLNTLACSLFHEENTYRIDHYLGKDTVENILAFRFTNPLFEAVWNNQYIDHIQITAAETAGVEGRTAFYADIGATRDLLQNHLMQLITLLTIDQPSALTFDALADAKKQILEMTHVIPEQSVLGQYDDPAIIETLGTTETYVMATFVIHTPRWEGVPIYVRTGKKLAEKVTEVAVHFKPNEQQLFGTPSGSFGNNVITFRIQPNEGVFVKFAVKVPGEREQVEMAQMVFCYDAAFRLKLADAYENLFAALFSGVHVIALRGDIIEESWRIIDELLAARDRIPFAQYPVGSWGPENANEILRQRGRAWEVAEQNVCNGVTIQ